MTAISEQFSFSAYVYVTNVYMLASEVFRHIELLGQGQRVPQETRGFDEQKAETFALRSKEDAPDYRYMPDPNLPPLLLDEVGLLVAPTQGFHLITLIPGLCYKNS